MEQLVDHKLQLRTMKQRMQRGLVKNSRDEGAVLTCGARGHKVICDTVALASIRSVNIRSRVVIIG